MTYYYYQAGLPLPRKLPIYSRQDIKVPEYAKKKTEFDIDDILNQKTSLLGDRLKMITNSIGTRKEIMGKNLLGILRDECGVETTLMNIAPAYRDLSGQDRLKTQLESDLLRLDKERREEEVNCFRDIQMLEKEYRDILEMYLKSNARNSLFGE